MPARKQMNSVYKQNRGLFAIYFAFVIVYFAYCVRFEGVVLSIQHEVHLCMVIDVFFTIQDPTSFKCQCE